MWLTDIVKGAGPIKCMPNMTKLLEKWGMGDDLRSKGTVCNAMQFTDSERFLFLSLRKRVLKTSQAQRANWWASRSSTSPS